MNFASLPVTLHGLGRDPGHGARGEQQLLAGLRGELPQGRLRGTRGDVVVLLDRHGGTGDRRGHEGQQDGCSRLEHTREKPAGTPTGRGLLGHEV